MQLMKSQPDAASILWGLAGRDFSFEFSDLLNKMSLVGFFVVSPPTSQHYFVVCFYCPPSLSCPPPFLFVQFKPLVFLAFRLRWKFRMK